MENIEAAESRSLFSSQPLSRKICIVAVMTALCAMLGWICETIFFLIIHDGEFIDRGLLTLPFCPLYGFGALIVFLVLRTPQSGIWAKIYNRTNSRTGKIAAVIICIIMYAAAASLLASLVEYITGVFFDKAMNMPLWSYERYPDNINGYVCFRYSLLWGLLCVSSMGLFWHPVSNVLAKLNTAVLATLAIALTVIIAADFTFNMLYLYKHNEHLTVLEDSVKLLRELKNRCAAFCLQRIKNILR